LEPSQPHVDLAERVTAFLRRQPFPLGTEMILQANMAVALKAGGFVFERERRLARPEDSGVSRTQPKADIADFFLPCDGGNGVVVEVKIKGSRRALLDQCERYCQSPDTAVLVVATNLALGFPESLHGKPCFVASLGRGWL
jgi:hypothetical protein